MQLLVQSDVANDQRYIALTSRAFAQGSVAKSVRATDDITLDFDAEGRLLGLDVTNASRVLPSEVNSLEADSLVSVKEAAALAGLQRSNFVRDVASRDDFPAPVAELATGRVWLRSAVSEYLNSRPEASRRRNTASPPKKR